MHVLLVWGRWALAVAAAGFAFLIVFVLMAALFNHFGGGASRASQSYIWAVALATYVGTLAGALMAPREKRRSASYLFLALIGVLTVGGLVFNLINRTFKPTDLYDVLGWLMGGFIVLRTLSRFRKLPPSPL